MTDQSNVSDEYAQGLLMVEELRAMKQSVSEQTNNLKKKKAEFRTFLINSGYEQMHGVKLQRGFTLDLELIRLELPAVFASYCKYEKSYSFKCSITPSKKKALLEKFPQIMQDKDFYREKTPRLMGL